MNSKYLSMLIGQLQSGLIAEHEFVMAMQLNEIELVMMNQWSKQLPDFPVPQDYPNITLDLFSSYVLNHVKG